MCCVVLCCVIFSLTSIHVSASCVYECSKYNPPPSQTNTNNHKKPSTAGTKSTKHRMSNKANDRDVDFNDCEVVEDNCELQHNNPFHPSSKPPSDHSSCRSSPSPEQVNKLNTYMHMHIHI